jgi:hypothetical protein
MPLAHTSLSLRLQHTRELLPRAMTANVKETTTRLLQTLLLLLTLQVSVFSATVNF